MPRKRVPEAEKKKSGRPPNDLTADQRKAAIKLAGIHCTMQEIAATLEIPWTTFYAYLAENPNFANTLKESKDAGRSSLRRTLWKHASTNVAAAIFLAKQRDLLAMTDRPPEEVPGQAVVNEIRMEIIRKTRSEKAEKNAKNNT